MSHWSQRTAKLSNIKLTLSKYDAKYSKPSGLLDENSSDEAESTDERRPKSLDRSLTDTQIEAVHPSTSGDYIEPVSPKTGRENQDHQEGQVSTVVNIEPIEPSESLSSNKLEIKHQTSGQSNSPTDDYNSLIETASCIESVKTDSVLSFGNVHSVSSLAESVLLFVDGAGFVNQRGLITTTEAENLSRSSTSSSSLNIHHSTSEKPSTALNVKSAEKLLFLDAVDEKYSEPTASPEPEQLLSLVIVNKPKKSSCGEAKGKFSMQNNDTGFKLPRSFSENDKTTSFRMSGMKQAAHEEVASDCKCSSTNCLKLSVATQTRDNSIGELSNSQSIQTKIRLPCSAKSTENISPIIKAMKLPSFLKDGCTIPQHKDMQCSVEDEISKLVSHHVYLTKEFLKRQHRMYIANCKAVKLLDEGLRENSLWSTCKCKQTSSPSRKMV